MRAAVFARDQGICAVCGADTEKVRARIRSALPALSGEGRIMLRRAVRADGWNPDGPWWEADHIVPLEAGGRDRLDNLQTLCRPDHLAKSAAQARSPFRRRARRRAARLRRKQRRQAWAASRRS